MIGFIKHMIQSVRRRIILLCAEADLVSLTEQRNRLNAMIERAEKEKGQLQRAIDRRYAIIKANTRDK